MALPQSAGRKWPMIVHRSAARSSRRSTDFPVNTQSRRGNFSAPVFLFHFISVQFPDIDDFIVANLSQCRRTDVTACRHPLRPQMTERHLILQESVLPPSSEWTPRNPGWLMARVSDGVGYWMQPGAGARELAAGDGFIVGHNSNGVLRASQLSPLKLQFFIIQPQHLNGLLAVTEWHQLEVAPNNLSSHVSIFLAAEPTGQKFARLANQSPSDKLPVRCALLQLWANAMADLLPAPLPVAGLENKLRERF